MATPVIIDAFAAFLLLGLALLGARRGLLKSLAGVVILAVSLVGAGMIAATFSGPAAKTAAPLLEAYITRQVEEAVAVHEGPSSDWEDDNDMTDLVPGLLERLGLDAEERAALTEPIRKALRETGQKVSDSVVAAVVTEAALESLVQSMLYGVIYTVAFVLLVILLKILTGAMNLVTRLPGVHGLNALGGVVLGLAEAALLLFLVVWVLRQLGVSFEEEPWTQTCLFRLFTTRMPLSVLSFPR